jgi:metallophosphoesterase (TIGR00282 family)
MRVLFLGDVVGRPGRRAVGRLLPRLIEREGCSSWGELRECFRRKGIDPDGAEELYDAGADVLTSGNHVWQHSSIIDYMRDNSRLLRPANFPSGVPGIGYTVHRGRRADVGVGVVNLIGRVFMGPADCPFRTAEQAIEVVRAETSVILVDMHAEATSEKVGMGRFLDGKVSAVVGSHTHVQTADEEVLPGGTAYLTDAGMCGPDHSVLGIRTDQVLRRFVTQMPTRFEVAPGPVIVQGAIIDLDPVTGRATGIRRVRERVDQ